MPSVTAGKLTFDVTAEGAAAVEQKMAELGRKLNAALNKGGNGALGRSLKAQTAAANENLAAIKRLSNEAATLRDQWNITGQSSTELTAKLKQVRQAAIEMGQGFELGSQEMRASSLVAAQATRTIAAMNTSTAELGAGLQVLRGGLLILPGPLGQVGYGLTVAESGLSGVAEAAGISTGAMLGIAGGVAAAGVAAIASAEDFAQLQRLQESVSSVTGMTASQMNTLNSRLKDISQTLPVTREQLYQMARDAALMGVQGTQNIAQFVDVIANVGVATRDANGQMADLGELAKEIATFLNETGTSAADYSTELENVAASLAEVDKATPGAIQDTLQLARYMASGSVTLGLTKAEIIGIAGALSGLGARAQAGGSSLIRVISQMELAAESGGAKFKAFSNIAGQTTEQFKALIKESPAKALLALADGLNKAHTEGKDFVAILDELGIKNIRDIRLIDQLTVGHNALATALQKALGAEGNYSSLTDRTTKATDNLKDKTKELHNAFVNLGADLGSRTEGPLNTLVSEVDTLINQWDALISLSDKTEQQFEDSVQTYTQQFGTKLGPALAAIQRQIDDTATHIADLKKEIAYDKGIPNPLNVLGLKGTIAGLEDDLAKAQARYATLKAAQQKAFGEASTAPTPPPAATRTVGMATLPLSLQSYVAEAKRLQDALDAAAKAGDSETWVQAKAKLDAFNQGQLDGYDDATKAAQALAFLATQTKNVGSAAQGAKPKIETVSGILGDLSDKVHTALATSNAYGNTLQSRLTSVQTQESAIQSTINTLLSKPYSLSSSSNKIVQLIDWLEQLKQKAKGLKAQISNIPTVFTTSDWVKKLQLELSEHLISGDTVRDQLTDALLKVEGEIKDFGPLDSVAKIKAFFNLEQVEAVLKQGLNSILNPPSLGSAELQRHNAVHAALSELGALTPAEADNLVNTSTFWQTYGKDVGNIVLQGMADALRKPQPVKLTPQQQNLLSGGQWAEGLKAAADELAKERRIKAGETVEAIAQTWANAQQGALAAEKANLDAQAALFQSWREEEAKNYAQWLDQQIQNRKTRREQLGTINLSFTDVQTMEKTLQEQIRRLFFGASLQIPVQPKLKLLPTPDLTLSSLSIAPTGIIRLASPEQIEAASQLTAILKNAAEAEKAIKAGIDIPPETLGALARVGAGGNEVIATLANLQDKLAQAQTTYKLTGDKAQYLDTKTSAFNQAVQSLIADGLTPAALALQTVYDKAQQLGTAELFSGQQVESVKQHAEVISALFRHSITAEANRTRSTINIVPQVSAKVLQDALKDTSAYADVINKLHDSLFGVNVAAGLFTTTTEDLETKSNAYESAIKTLIAEGFPRYSDAVQGLIDKYQTLQKTIGDIGAKANFQDLTAAQRRVAGALAAGEAPLETDIALLQKYGLYLGYTGPLMEKVAKAQIALANSASDLSAVYAALAPQTDTLAVKYGALEQAVADAFHAGSIGAQAFLKIEKELAQAQQGEQQAAATSSKLSTLADVTQRYLQLTGQAPSDLDVFISRLKTLEVEYPKQTAGLEVMVQGLEKLEGQGKAAATLSLIEQAVSGLGQTLGGEADEFAKFASGFLTLAQDATGAAKAATTGDLISLGIDALSYGIGEITQGWKQAADAATVYADAVENGIGVSWKQVAQAENLAAYGATKTLNMLKEAIQIAQQNEYISGKGAEQLIKTLTVQHQFLFFKWDTTEIDKQATNAATQAAETFGSTLANLLTESGPDFSKNLDLGIDKVIQEEVIRGFILSDAVQAQIAKFAKDMQAAISASGPGGTTVTSGEKAQLDADKTALEAFLKQEHAILQEEFPDLYKTDSDTGSTVPTFALPDAVFKPAFDFSALPDNMPNISAASTFASATPAFANAVDRFDKAIEEFSDRAVKEFGEATQRLANEGITINTTSGQKASSGALTADGIRKAGS